MIEGPLGHGTDAEIESNRVDTHGASVVGFAFTDRTMAHRLPRPVSAGAEPVGRVRVGCARASTARQFLAVAVRQPAHRCFRSMTCPSAFPAITAAYSLIRLFV